VSDTTVDESATFVYGRAHMARTRTMCSGVGNCTGYGTFYYEIYADKKLADYNQTLITSLLGTPKRSVDSVTWYQNTKHVPATDGNVSASAAVPDMSAAYATLGATTKGTFVYNESANSRGYPYKVSVEVSEPTQTQSWLIYDKYNGNSDTVSGQLEFYGPGNWTSSGSDSLDTKSTTNSNANKNTNRRIRW